LKVVPLRWALDLLKNIRLGWKVLLIKSQVLARLMFLSKFMSLPNIGAPEKCSSQVGSGLTFKHLTRLESALNTTRIHG